VRTSSGGNYETSTSSRTRRFGTRGNGICTACQRQKWLPSASPRAVQDGKGAIGCTYCHTSPSGGGSWNKFGQAMRDLYFGDAKRNVGNMLYLTLKANKDSDGDKYTDVLEIVAKTLPGDASSKPSKTVAALEAELKALGGVDAFKAK
jgi:hypothetical protein